MLQFITFAIIYGIMLFIWSFVYINKSNDKINQAFLYFLSVILLWMVLSVSNNYNNNSAFGLMIKIIYFISMFNISIFFLLFIYRLLKKKLDHIFYIIIIINTLTIFIRCILPMDFSDPTFWRLTDPVIAPIMSTVFSFPAIFALILVIQRYGLTKDIRLKMQLRYIFLGIGTACFISVVSEYVLPTWFHIKSNLSLMYFAILVFVVFVFISIMKYKFLNMQSEYIYQKLFLNSTDGTIIINKNYRIMNINHMAKEILQNENMSSGDKITDYIKGYAFETNYKQHEVTIKAGTREKYLTLTQYPMDAEDQDSAKLMIITDITSTKLNLIREKDLLIEKSSMDQLTGLYNKQYFIENYSAGKQESIGDKLGLMFIDVDNFKAINDLYGHLAGDKVLTSLAACIKNEIGSDTKAFRFGGDEFVVIFENATINDTYLAAERIRDNANNLDFSEYDEKLKISLSIGVVEGIEPVNDLITKADIAMYSSKSNGKNRTTIFSE